jgi:hypothetical protein
MVWPELGFVLVVLVAKKVIVNCGGHRVLPSTCHITVSHLGKKQSDQDPLWLKATGGDPSPKQSRHARGNKYLWSI